VVDPTALASLASSLGLCRPSPSTHAAHFSTAASPECGGQRGTLAPGGAYPDLERYLRSDVRLAPLAGG
jgi:hypothetical protein